MKTICTLFIGVTIFAFLSGMKAQELLDRTYSQEKKKCGICGKDTCSEAILTEKMDCLTIMVLKAQIYSLRNSNDAPAIIRQIDSLPNNSKHKELNELMLTTLQRIITENSMKGIE